jgi:hypothetical protein
MYPFKNWRKLNHCTIKHKFMKCERMMIARSQSGELYWLRGVGKCTAEEVLAKATISWQFTHS